MSGYVHMLVDHTLVDHTPTDEGRSVLMEFLFDGVFVQSLNLSASPQVSEDTYAHHVKKLSFHSHHDGRGRTPN